VRIIRKEGSVTHRTLITSCLELRGSERRGGEPVDGAVGVRRESDLAAGADGAVEHVEEEGAVLGAHGRQEVQVQAAQAAAVLQQVEAGAVQRRARHQLQLLQPSAALRHQRRQRLRVQPAAVREARRAQLGRPGCNATSSACLPRTPPLTQVGQALLAHARVRRVDGRDRDGIPAPDVLAQGGRRGNVDRSAL